MHTWYLDFLMLGGYLSETLSLYPWIVVRYLNLKHTIGVSKTLKLKSDAINDGFTIAFDFVDAVL